MERNLPATRPDVATDAAERAALEPRRPLSVALLPLALVAFVIMALVIAAWTFLAAAT